MNEPVRAGAPEAPVEAPPLLAGPARPARDPLARGAGAATLERVISGGRAALAILEEVERAEAAPAGSRRPRKPAEEPAFLLHSYPWSESSLVLDALTARFGRVFLIARGAKRPGSNLRGVLVPFTPLKLTWTGLKEAKVLTCAEWFGVLPPLRGEALLSGFYVNELVLRLTEREDPHPGLFTAYVRVMEALCEDAAADRQRGLRAFEAELLRICGWPVAIDETGGEDGSGAEPAQSLRTGLADAVAREEDPCAERFWRLGELGALVPARAPADPAQARFRAWGDALVRDVLAGRLESPEALRAAREIYREAIELRLDGRPLRSRRILAELKRL